MKHEVDLSFNIWGYEDVMHEDITAMVGVAPYKVFIKGQRKSAVSSALSKENGWILKPECDKYASFEEQMNLLLDIIESKHSVFRVLSEKYYCEFSCALYLDTDSEESVPWIHLDKRYHQLAKDLNVEFDFDIMLVADE